MLLVVLASMGAANAACTQAEPCAIAAELTLECGGYYTADPGKTINFASLCKPNVEYLWDVYDDVNAVIATSGSTDTCAFSWDTPVSSTSETYRVVMTADSETYTDPAGGEDCMTECTVYITVGPCTCPTELLEYYCVPPEAATKQYCFTCPGTQGIYYIWKVNDVVVTGEGGEGDTCVSIAWNTGTYVPTTDYADTLFTVSVEVYNIPSDAATGWTPPTGTIPVFDCDIADVTLNLLPEAVVKTT